MKRRILLLAIALVASDNVATADAVDDMWRQMTPYRGEYRLASEGRRDEGQFSIEGRMQIEGRITCAESLATTTTDARVSNRSGQMRAVQAVLREIESLDGKTLRFTSRVTIDGRVVNAAEGQASLETRDGPGDVTIRAARTEKRQLQSPIVLGGTAGMKLLAAAASGASSFRHRVLFVGDGLQIMDVRSAISKPGRSSSEPALGEFANRPGWTFRKNLRVLAGKDAETNSGEESFVTEDGVVTHLVMVLMNVRVVAKPTTIEKLPKPACKS